MNKHEEKVENEWDDFLFHVRVSIRYHRRRRDFYQRRHALANAIIIIFSSTAVFSLLHDLNKWLSSLPGLIVTIVATFDFVFGTCSKISTHDNIVRRLLLIEEEIMIHTTSNNGTYNKLLKDWQAIKKDEPDTLKVLTALCHNQIVRSMDCSDDEQIPTTWIQRQLADFIDIRDHELKKGK